MKEWPEYKRENDVFWRVNRDFCAVSNWTYGPIEDWEEDKIRKSVNILRESIIEMLWHLEDQKKSE